MGILKWIFGDSLGEITKIQDDYYESVAKLPLFTIERGIDSEGKLTFHLLRKEIRRGTFDYVKIASNPDRSVLETAIKFLENPNDCA